MKTIKYTIESITQNYKFWLAWVFSLYLIRAKGMITTIISFIVAVLWSYGIHYASHSNSVYPFNIIHIYHHANSHLFSHIIEIILEFFTLLYIIPCKYVLFSTYNIEIPILDNWIIMFAFLVYVTVHNINYSVFHVNNTHELHHQLLTCNYGPDICDILFNTKHEPHMKLENTDHYVPNILGAGLAVYFMQCIWTNSTIQQKETYRYIFGALFTTSFLLSFGYSAFFYCKDLDLFLKKEVTAFCQ